MACEQKIWRERSFTLVLKVIGCLHKADTSSLLQTPSSSCTIKEEEPSVVEINKSKRPERSTAVSNVSVNKNWFWCPIFFFCFVQFSTYSVGSCLKININKRFLYHHCLLPYEIVLIIVIMIWSGIWISDPPGDLWHDAESSDVSWTNPSPASTVTSRSRSLSNNDWNKKLCSEYWQTLFHLYLCHLHFLYRALDNSMEACFHNRKKYIKGTCGFLSVNSLFHRLFSQNCGL